MTRIPIRPPFLLLFITLFPDSRLSLIDEQHPHPISSSLILLLYHFVLYFKMSYFQVVVMFPMDPDVHVLDFLIVLPHINHLVVPYDQDPNQTAFSSPFIPNYSISVPGFSHNFNYLGHKGWFSRLKEPYDQHPNPLSFSSLFPPLTHLLLLSSTLPLSPSTLHFIFSTHLFPLLNYALFLHELPFRVQLPSKFTYKVPY